MKNDEAEVVEVTGEGEGEAKKSIAGVISDTRKGEDKKFIPREVKGTGNVTGKESIADDIEVRAEDSADEEDEWCIPDDEDSNDDGQVEVTEKDAEMHYVDEEVL